MNYTEEEGKTVEEAIKKSLDKLGISFDEAYIEVLNDGKNEQSARVGVGYKNADGMIRNVVETVLSKMDIRASIDIRDEDGIYIVNVRAKKYNGLLIGKDGGTLLAFQHILRRILQRKLPEVKIDMDIGNYRAKRYNKLVRLSRELSGKVKETGKEVKFEPLRAYERWIVHTTLNDDPDVFTYTTGNGEFRTIVVAPRKKKIA